MVIVRCCGPDEFFLERVVFPFELLSFDCPSDSDVAIWTHGLGGPELIESFRAEELQLTQPCLVAGVGAGSYESPWLEAG